MLGAGTWSEAWPEARSVPWWQVLRYPTRFQIYLCTTEGLGQVQRELYERQVLQDLPSVLMWQG